MLNAFLQEQICTHLGSVDKLPPQYRMLFEEISMEYDEHEKARNEKKNMIANLNAIINSNDDLIFSVDTSYKMLCANNAFLNNMRKLTGQVLHEGDSLLVEDIGEEWILQWKQYIDQSLQGETMKIEISEELGKELQYIELSFNPIREENEVIGVACFARDITKEKLNAQQLLANEVRFRSLIENSQELLILFDAKKNIEYISPAVEDTFSYTNEENSRDVMEDIHPDDHMSFLEQFELALENSGMPIPSTLRKRTKEGGYLWLQGSLTNMLHLPGVYAVVGQYRDITEKKSTSEKLRRSETHLQTIFNNADTGYVLLDRNLRVVYFNQHSQKFAQEELFNTITEGRYALDLFPFSRRDSIASVLDKVMEGNTLSYDVNYTQPDGSEKWYHAKYFPVSNDSQGVFGIILSLTNFTEQKLSDQHIKESNDRFTLVAKATKDVVWDWDLLTDEIYYGEGYEINFGYKHAEKSNTFYTMLERIHPDDRERISKGLRAAIYDPQVDSWTDEYCFIKADGTEAYIRDSGYIVYNEKKRPIRVVGAMQDITARKKVEDELHKSERRLREISSSIPGVVYQFMIDGTGIPSIPYISEGAQALLGTTPEEVQKEFNFNFTKIHPDDKDLFLKSIELSAATMEPWLYVFRTFVPEYRGYKWIRGNSVPRRLEDGGILWNGTMIDVTEQKLAEIELRKLAADVLQRNKNLEQFSFIVSHNLRAPVANILGISSALQEEKSENPIVQELREGLYASAMILDEVLMDLNNILQVKHEINEIKETVLFAKLVSDVKVSLKLQLESSQTVIECDFDEVAQLHTLKSYIQSVFYNLIFNSVKYRQPDVAPLIQVRSRRVNNSIELAFKDNGRGIDLSENGNQVFGLYKRFHTEIEGKGMGLFMVRTQVEAIGGRISVHSEVNQGTEFRIIFEDK